MGSGFVSPCEEWIDEEGFDSCLVAPKAAYLDNDPRTNTENNQDLIPSERSSVLWMTEPRAVYQDNDRRMSIVNTQDRNLFEKNPVWKTFSW